MQVHIILRRFIPEAGFCGQLTVTTHFGIRHGIIYRVTDVGSRHSGLYVGSLRPCDGADAAHQRRSHGTVHSIGYSSIRENPRENFPPGKRKTLENKGFQGFFDGTSGDNGFEQNPIKSSVYGLFIHCLAIMAEKPIDRQLHSYRFLCVIEIISFSFEQLSVERFANHCDIDIEKTNSCGIM